MSAPESAGLGVSIEIDDSLPTALVWEVLCHKVLSPQDYLPVTDVLTRPSDDGKGTYREMTTAFNAANGLPERRIIENIYTVSSHLSLLPRLCLARAWHAPPVTSHSPSSPCLPSSSRIA